LSRLRWFVAKPGTGYRGLEEIVNRACRPALEASRAAGLLESAYVSKKGTEIWLTAFSDLSRDVSTIALIEPHLSGYCYRSGHGSDPATEEMLQSRCDEFRQCLDLMTRIALDVHGDQDLISRQKALIWIGKHGRHHRDLLDPFLRENSPTFCDIADPEAFWSRLGCNCLSGPTDCLHWLYNIVLGFDWEWHLSEQRITEQLGLPWP
jgi:hypothetical protein